MKRLSIAFCLLLALSLPSSGGEVSTPGAAQLPTPICTENCPNTPPTTNSAGNTSTTTDDMIVTIMQLFLSLIV